MVKTPAVVGGDGIVEPVLMTIDEAVVIDEVAVHAPVVYWVTKASPVEIVQAESM